MAYNALNNLIDAYIYANGVQAITGQILNGVLKQMVSQLGSGYHLMGVAGPETVPASNDYAMAYFAATAGEYTDFGGITLTAGEVAVLLTSGNGSWEKQTIYTVPTGTADLENTANFITNAVTDLVNYYTKTEVDAILENYPTLEGLATALADYYTKDEIDALPNEEDINFNEDGKLQLANRSYSAQQPNGMGYVILRRNKTFAEQVTETNTIYEIRYDFNLSGSTVTVPSGCVLRFSGGAVTNGSIQGRPTVDAPLVKIFDSVDFPDGLSCPFRVEWFGAIQDGVTDSAPGIRACIASLPDSDFVIEFSPGKYIQGDGNNLTPCCFDIQNKSHFVIKGNGAEIQANPGNSCIQNNRGFYLVFCRDAVIENIKYDGNILERKPAMGDGGGVNRQSAFELRGCTRVSLIGCSAIGSIMDGFFIGYERNQQSELVYSNYCKLINCFSEKSYRQGVTVCGGNYGVIDGCVLKDIGTTPYSASPRCGIDFEDGYFNGQDSWSITNTNISGCAGSALSLSAGTRNTHVVSCCIDGSVFHNDNNNPDLILGNIISNCLIKNTTIFSYCAGLSLVNNEIIGTSDLGNTSVLYFSNSRNLEIKSIDKIFGNNIKFEWNPSIETYSGGMPSTYRGLTLFRPLDFENNILENFSGVNPINTNVPGGYPLKNVRKFNHNTIRSSYDVTQYGGARLASFTGQGAIQARIYHDNIVDGLYSALQENLFDVFNSPNDLRRFYKFPYLQVKGENVIYDMCLGQFSLLKNPTYIRVKFDEMTWYMLTKGNGTTMTYKIEKGTSANGLLFSELYQDTDGFAHILINSSSGGYFYPIIELFWNGGALPPDTGKYFYMTRRTKTAEDAARTYTAPTLDTPTQF